MERRYNYFVSTVTLAQIADALDLSPELLHAVRESGVERVKVRISDIAQARRRGRELADVVAAAEH